MHPFNVLTSPAKIVGDTDFETFYPAINTNTDWESILPYINDAVSKYIIPFISEDWYNALIAKTTFSTHEAKAHVLLKRATAYYTAMYAYTKEQDMFTNTGVMQDSPDHARTNSIASQKMKLWDLTITADDHLDALLAFLEIRVQGGDTNFNLFKTSTAYKNGKSSLFKATYELQEFHNINNSRRTYLALLPALNDAAELYLKPQIGAAIFDEVSTQFHANTLTADNTKLLKQLRQALVKYALVIAADTEGVLFDNQSAIRVVSNADGMDTRETQITARMKVRQSSRLVNENLANRYMTNLTDFLNANLTLYPTYANQMVTPTDLRRRNKIVTTTDENGITKGGIGIF